MFARRCGLALTAVVTGCGTVAGTQASDPGQVRVQATPAAVQAPSATEMRSLIPARLAAEEADKQLIGVSGTAMLVPMAKSGGPTRSVQQFGRFGGRGFGWGGWGWGGPFFGYGARLFPFGYGAYRFFAPYYPMAGYWYPYAFSPYAAAYPYLAAPYLPGPCGMYAPYGFGPAWIGAAIGTFGCGGGYPIGPYW